MTEMTPEVLKFTGKPENNKNNYSNLGKEVDGSLARVLEPADNSDGLNQDVHDFLKKEGKFAEDESSKIKAEIFGIKKTIKIDGTGNVLPFTKIAPEGALITNYPEVRKAPPGVVIGPVGNQGREASGGDRTGGEKKKGRGVRILAGAIAGVVATAGLGYGIFKDKIDSFFGGGVDPNSLPPGQTVSASGEMPSQSENIESPTPSTEVTPEVTQSPSPEPTETPIVLDEFGFSEERKAELTQQFQDFLNKQGEFTPEKMSLIMMETPSNLDKNEVGLGIADTGDVPRMQGYFFDYLEKDGRIFLFVGFDGKDGNRFITPLEIPIYYYESFKQSRFDVIQYKKNTITVEGENTESQDYSDDESKLISLLNSIKSGIVMFNLISQEFDESKWDKYDLGAETRQNVTDYVKEVNSKVELTFGLFQLSPQNGIPSYTNPDRIKGDSESILKITSSDEMSKINIDQVPMISSISYFRDK